MSAQPGTNLERQIRSQPDQLSHLLTSEKVREQIHGAAEGLQRARRIWLVGTGTSHHAAILGAGMLQDAGRSAVAVSSMRFVVWAPIVGADDTIILITHTGETAYALAARALATTAGLDVITITSRGARFPHSVETCARETSETYTVSYTTTLLTLALIAKEMGADSITDGTLALVPGSVSNAIDDPDTGSIRIPERALVIAGAGPAAFTAREGALKLREGARVLAEGHDIEFLLHGSAVPLGASDALLTLITPDADGFVAAVTAAASAEGITTYRLAEPARLPMLLAQIPLTVRLQLLALRLALERGQDPDTVITGNWAEPGLWKIGRPDQ
jgi:glucosamine--fructose-6-phosphate aminotransferase (isomerizing)